MKTIDTKKSDAGILVTKESDTHTQYEITTNPWFWRGWKIYFRDKVVKILSWTAIITLELDGKDEEITLNSESGEFLIPTWVPNVFYFPELTKIIETFLRDTKTQEFERYRAMKKEL
jgi:hypothetical protein